jgi:hypothetical protein
MMQFARVRSVLGGLSVAMFAFAALAVSAPTAALAAPSGGDPCTANHGYWSLDDVTQREVPFYDVYNHTTNYYFVELDHYGCSLLGLEYYTSKQWFWFYTPHWYPHTSLNVTTYCVYVWSYTGSWSSNSMSVSSAAYSLDGALSCGASANNGSTYVYLPYNGSWLSGSVSR